MVLMTSVAAVASSCRSAEVRVIVQAHRLNMVWRVYIVSVKWLTRFGGEESGGWRIERKGCRDHISRCS
jgi:hypothetical protein